MAKALQSGNFGPGSLGPGTISGEGVNRPRPCCCGCIYYQNRFDVEDTSDLGEDLEVRAGDGSIADRRLRIVDSNTLIRCLAEEGDDPHVVRANMRGRAAGDQPRLISNFRNDSNYWFVELTAGEHAGELKVWERIDDVDYQRGDTYDLDYYGLVGRYVQVEIRFGSAGICVYAGGPDAMGQVLVYGTSALTDNWCGVGSGTVNEAVEFDDFVLEYHGEIHDGCSKCSLPCEHCTKGAPPGLIVTFDGLAGTDQCATADLACWNNTAIHLASLHDWVDGCHWRGWAKVCGAEYCREWGDTGERFDASIYKHSVTGTYRLDLEIFRERWTSPTRLYRFEADLGPDRPDCLEWNDVSMSLVDKRHDAPWDVSGATVAVSSWMDSEPPVSLGTILCQDCGEPPEEIEVIWSGLRDSVYDPLTNHEVACGLSPINGVPYILRREPFVNLVCPVVYRHQFFEPIGLGRGMSVQLTPGKDYFTGERGIGADADIAVETGNQYNCYCSAGKPLGPWPIDCSAINVTLLGELGTSCSIRGLP